MRKFKPVEIGIGVSVIALLLLGAYFIVEAFSNPASNPGGGSAGTGTASGGIPTKPAPQPNPPFVTPGGSNTGNSGSSSGDPGMPTNVITAQLVLLNPNATPAEQAAAQAILNAADASSAYAGTNSFENFEGLKNIF